MREEIIMLKIFLSIFIIIGFACRYMTDDESNKIIVDIFLIYAIMHFIWC